MIAVRRGLFLILGAATAATTLAVSTPAAHAQAAKKANRVKAASKGHKGGTGTGTTGTGTGTTGSGTGSTGTGSSSPVQYFPSAAIWTQDVSSAPVDPQSAAMINSMSQAGGWGTGVMRVDFSIRVMQANASTPTVPFTPGQGFYSADSDVV